ncbi:transketolase [Candidatus Epulonipiscium fishelsonii]|uniref:Transketolase n=1 Tax=Candidatus Epulonipiscium fishelsonii TaxID=77094 RepID=A0ACC8X8S5_9FIRM|nr:transketolase [Epulopiscium sp. SCG-B11WGA-EpuloA1]ONI38978.1 transketolase [Epulopiscium sp. SCG-B05WGA-EpuloA1]
METVTKVHEKFFVEWAKDKEDIIVLSGDLTKFCELKAFEKNIPERFINMGMAEQNMMSWAGGLAREGYIPMVYTFATFASRRPLDHVQMSIAYPNLPVKIFGFLPGITTNGGPTHQAIDDISIMRAIPSMTVIEVGDVTDIETVLDVIYKIDGPVYIRSLRSIVPRLFPKDEKFELNKARVVSEGDDVTVLTSGMMTEEAIRLIDVLKTKGLKVEHLHISTLKPFSDMRVVEACKKTKSKVITYENHLTTGGLGSAVADLMAEHGIGKPLVKIGLADTYAEGSHTRYILEKYKMDWQALLEKIEEAVGQKFNIKEEDLKPSSVKRIDSV